MKHKYVEQQHPTINEIHASDLGLSRIEYGWVKHVFRRQAPSLKS